MDRKKDWKDSVRVIGPVENINGVLCLKWSASGVEFVTDARKVEAVIVSEWILPEETAWLGVIINDEEKPYKKIAASQKKERCVIYQSKEKTRVRIRLVKLTEEQYGRIGLADLSADGEMLPVGSPDRKILFIGDSITAGFGVDGIDGISEFTTTDEDVTAGYAWQTARALGTDSRIIAYSGNGVLSRYIPPEQDVPLTTALLPDIFPYDLDYDPSFIVCNLGTNDASYTRGIPEREEMFVKRYTEFITRLSRTYAGADILLVYGMVEQTLWPCVKETASLCSTFCMKLPLQDKRDGIGAQGHPNRITHKKTAGILEEYIRTIKGWH